MYTIILDEGIVIDSNGVIILPCQSPDDVLFVHYANWLNEGNEPIILVTRG